jgi:2-methylcitrate dehydratase PrpD
LKAGKDSAMDITRELATYCRGLKFRQLPEPVVDRVKYLFLDFIGVACRGSKTDSSKSLFRYIREEGAGRPQGVVIGIPDRAPYGLAALANGTLAHAIEMDDVNNESSLHPGVAVFPAALAASERKQGSGEKFIEAVIAGYEVMIRLGKALGPENSYRRGFHPTGTCGVFGAAMAAALLYGLNGKDLIHALGIAGSQASGSMEYLAQGAWTKRFHAGWAALSGLTAAGLAQNKFRGPETIIEGRFGFLHGYSEKSDPSKVLDDLGEDFEVLHTSIKPYACCRYMQPPIDAVIQIMNNHGLNPQEVKEIDLGILRAGSSLIAEPLEEKYEPKCIVDAQFSMPFGAAVAALYGKAGLKEFQMTHIRSDKVRAMMQKVRVHFDPSLEKTFPRQWAGTSRIVTSNGREYTAKVEYPKGDPENPLSQEDLIAKFHDLSGGIFDKSQRAMIVEQVRGLERIDDFSKWATLLSARK